MNVSGRHLSRAWLAVLCAAAEDEPRPALHRAVHVEEYPGQGLRLVATDSYWLARCWVPAGHLMDDLGHTEPDDGELPDRTVTVIDDEWRVRDLMRFVAKATKKPGEPDIDVRLDLAATTYDEAAPTLTPEMAARRVRIELPDERVLGRVWDGEWVTWRELAHEFATAPRAGAVKVGFSGWMFAAMAKAATICSAPTIDIEWIDDRRGEWSLRGSALDFAPSGLLMAGASAAPPDEEGQ